MSLDNPNQWLILSCFEHLVTGNRATDRRISVLARNIVDKVRSGENIDIDMPVPTEYNGHVNMTLVCAAAAKGAFEYLIYFLDTQNGASANVNKCDSLHWSPLHFACMDGHPPNVRCLLDKGAFLFAKNVDGKTPLDVVNQFLVLQRTRARRADFRVIRDLLEHKTLRYRKKAYRWLLTRRM
jgi:hypothetical protein